MDRSDRNLLALVGLLAVLIAGAVWLRNHAPFTEEPTAGPTKLSPTAPRAAPITTPLQPAPTSDTTSFRGLLWGTPVARVGGLHAVDDKAAFGDGEWRAYARSFEDLQFDGATLESIRYYFRDGRFHTVILQSAPGQFEYLKQALWERYGPGNARNGFADQWWWDDSASPADEERFATIHLSKSLADTGYAQFTAVTHDGLYPYDRFMRGETGSASP